MPRDDLKGGFNVGHGYEIVSDFSCRCPNSFSCEVVQWKHFRAVARISFAREVLPWKHFRAVARISFVMEVLPCKHFRAVSRILFAMALLQWKL